jgi:hypothetical protein
VFKKRHNILSVVLGGFAGAMGGFVSQFQKISTASSISGELVSKLESPLSNPEALINPYQLQNRGFFREFTWCCRCWCQTGSDC